MNSNFLKVILTSLALTCVGGAGAVPAGVGSDHAPAISTSSTLEIASADSDRQAPAARQGAITLASISTLPSLKFGSQGHQDALGNKIAGLEFNEWMLIGLGIFLIGAISFRRGQSVMD